MSIRAEESSQSVAVKKLAQELGAATMKGDNAKVIDYTYDTLVKAMGGREKAIEAVEAVMKQMKAQGITIKVFHAGDPGEFLTEGGNTFVVVPTRVEAVFSKGKVISKSYVLGISSDEGKTWKFADGSGIIKQKELREKLLPKLPAKLKLPEREKPEIIPNN
ncbi:MAG: hypothetical protein ACKO23_00870 [Gemmataceae bacterium]